MGLFDHFPYTNFHELNLTWILNALKEIQTTMDQFVAINALKYADPIQWNIVSQYEKNTIVIDPLTGTAYISVQPVPSGVIITNTDYWSVVFDLGSFVVRAAKNFTDRWEEETTLTATFPTLAGEWLVWGDTLYKALVNIIAGDQYVIDSNIEHITMEQVIAQEINARIIAINNLEGDIAVNELDSSVATVNIPAGNLVWVNNELYMSIVPISVGDTFVVNTNITRVNVNDFVLNRISVNDNELRGNIAINELDSSVATVNIPAGNLVWVNNELYMSIVPITAGDTFEVDTNITRVNVNDFVLDRINVIVTSSLNPLISRVNAIADINKLVDEPPIYIFLGDSYESYSGWADKTAQYLGLTAEQTVNLCQDSTNIAEGYWLNILSTWVNDHPDLLSRVTHVVGGGGINDSSATANPLLENAIGQLATYVKNNLPNATLYLAYFGYALSSSPILMARDYLQRGIAQSTYSQCGMFGAVYLSGLEGVLHDKYLLAADQLHPNNYGGVKIASYLASALKTGSCNVSYHLQNATLTPYDPNATLNGSINEAIEDGIYYLHIDNLSLTGISPNTIGVNTGVASTLFNITLRYGDLAFGFDTTIFVVDQNTSDIIEVTGTLFISGGVLQFFTRNEITPAYISEIKPINLKISLPVMYS